MSDLGSNSFVPPKTGNKLKLLDFIWKKTKPKTKITTGWKQGKTLTLPPSKRYLNLFFLFSSWTQEHASSQGDDFSSGVMGYQQKEQKDVARAPGKTEQLSHSPWEVCLFPVPFPNHSQPFALPGQRVPGKVQVKSDFPKPLLDNLQTFQAYLCRQLAVIHILCLPPGSRLCWSCLAQDKSRGKVVDEDYVIVWNLTKQKSGDVY